RMGGGWRGDACLSVAGFFPNFRDYALQVKKPATERHESPRQLGAMLRDTFTRNGRQANFRLFCPDETNSNRLGAVFEVENRCLVDHPIPEDHPLPSAGRLIAGLTDHNLHPW